MHILYKEKSAYKIVRTVGSLKFTRLFSALKSDF